MATISCPDEVHLLPAALGQPIPGEISAHLAECLHCRRNVERLRAEVGALREVPTTELYADAPHFEVPTPPLYDAGREPPGPHPTAIGKYVILGTIDAGGQALVYRAVHPNLPRDLAIKIARQPTAIEGSRLKEDAAIICDLQHPNLVRIYDLDIHEGRPFVAMEYVRGGSLHQVVQESRPSPRQAAAWVAAVARAVGLAHRRGIVHQDIKPQNILVDEMGCPRLIDFGLARVRDAWSERIDLSVGGTLAFMAPEQARLETGQIGPQSDIFALGCVLFFLLTGRAPFAGADDDETWDRARRCDFDAGALRAAKVPRRLERIVLKAMASDPAHRYASATALAQALEQYCHRPIYTAAILGLAAAALLIAQAVAWPQPWSSSAGPPPQPVRIERMELTHSRNDGSTFLGTIGVDDTSVCLDNDEIQIHARLNIPAYCYLIALHPDGSNQLYYPEGSAGASTPPPLSDQVSYPLGNNLSPLTDGVGLQAFVLVASRKPLPAYSEWKARLGDLPWGKTQAMGVWHYNGQQYKQFSRRRSDPRPSAAAVPAPFASVCRALVRGPGIDAIDAWAFPVLPKDCAPAGQAPAQDRDCL
jgi:serine/threonine protein kinase